MDKMSGCVRKRIVIHLGSPKTGSTALQLSLLNNRDLLRSQGFDYQFFEDDAEDWSIKRGLTGGSIWNPIYPNIDGHFEVGDLQFEMVNKVLQITLKQLEVYDTVILSNEFLFLLASSPLFGKLISDFSLKNEVEIEMVMYLRSPFDFLLSWYSESVKRGFTVSKFPAYLENKEHILDTVYTALPAMLQVAKLFDIPFNLHVTRGRNYNVVENFYTNLGVEHQKMIPSQKSNQSLNIFEMDFFRGVHTVSRELGLIFCYERTDVHLASLYKLAKRKPDKLKMTEFALGILREKLSKVELELENVHPELVHLDYDIEGRFEVCSEGELDDEVSNSVFEIGVMVARSYKAGYLRTRLR